MTRRYNDDPYEEILEKMKEYPSGIPTKEGKVSAVSYRRKVLQAI